MAPVPDLIAAARAREAAATELVAELAGVIHRGRQLAKTPGRRAETDRWLGDALNRCDRVAARNDYPLLLDVLEAAAVNAPLWLHDPECDVVFGHPECTCGLDALRAAIEAWKAAQG